METIFQAYDKSLANIRVFKYLGRLLLATYFDWPSVMYNLNKSRKKLECTLQVLVC